MRNDLITKLDLTTYTIKASNLTKILNFILDSKLN